MEPTGPEEPQMAAGRKTLVVVIHGLGGSARRMGDVIDAVRTAYGTQTEVYAPDLPHGRKLSGTPATEIIAELLAGIDARDDAIRPERIVLVGHSVGATLARRLFLVAAGSPDNFRPGRRIGRERPRAWAEKVERIIMLAAFNRGWKISARMSWYYAALFNVVGLVGHILPGRLGWTPTAFDFRLGAPFMVQTRLHWLAYRRNPPPGIVHAERPMLIQLLGTQDDLIAPVDQVDLAVDGSDQAFLDGQTAGGVAGKTVQDYFLIEMPHTGHEEAIKLRGSGAALERGRLLGLVLTGSRSDFDGTTGKDRIAIDPALLVDEIEGLDNRVNDTVFVIHGIRDDGFWTHRIAEKVRELGGVDADGATVFRSWTPSYGYFAMLPFILPWIRFEKVEWFADQYVTAFAQYPRSNFHYVGHSNGTYLAARALADYPAIHFKHVLFAGSVVRRGYRWARLIDEKRVTAFQNLVAADDGVVALLPKSVEWLPGFDLGGAGFDGFREAGKRPAITEFKFLRGGHGAGIREEHWPKIARFIKDGVPFERSPTDPADLYDTHPDPTIAAFARLHVGLPGILAIGLLFAVLGYKLGGLFGLLVVILAIRFVVTRV